MAPANTNLPLGFASLVVGKSEKNIPHGVSMATYHGTK